MKRRSLQVWSYFLGAVLVGACSSKVLAPPRVDLKEYDTIGLVMFESDGDYELRKFATQQFQQTIQAAQPGVRVLELGTKDRLLASINHSELDSEATKALGRKYGINSLVVGHIDITEIKPKVRFSTSFKSLNAKGNVETTLNARLVETSSGATIWTDSSRASATVAHIDLVSASPKSFGAGSKDDAYRRAIEAVVADITVDFREHYVNK